mgnify:CR=1 FL=1
MHDRRRVHLREGPRLRLARTGGRRVAVHLEGVVAAGPDHDVEELHLALVALEHRLGRLHFAQVSSIVRLAQRGPVGDLARPGIVEGARLVVPRPRTIGVPNKVGFQSNRSLGQTLVKSAVFSRNSVRFRGNFRKFKVTFLKNTLFARQSSLSTGN